MKKNTSIYIGIVAFIALAGAGFYLWSSSDTATEDTAQELGEPVVTIVRTDQGYEPSEVTIQKGDIILWKNESSEFHWPASDLHPTHGIYPEFDPLRPLAPDEDWKFQFNQTGEWKFHDHIRANIVGTVIVTE